MSYKQNKFKFKNENTFDDRLKESIRVTTKYPDRIPIICQKANTKGTPDIDKNKFLASKQLTISQLIYIIRNRIKLSSTESLFLFCNNQIISGTLTIGEVYYNNKDDDGFLYLEYSKENVFG